MDDEVYKSHDGLLAEIAELRRRIAELKTLQDDQTGSELKNARDRFEYLLAFSPAIIYTTQASDGFACTYVTENIRSIMGFAPQEMTTDAKCWPDKLHPEDAQRVLGELGPLIEQGGGTVEYRFQHRDGHYVWIQDTFKVVYEGSKFSSPNWPKNSGPPIELVGLG